MPENECGLRTKPEIALAEIDHVITAGVRLGFVLADAGYGLSAPFRLGLSARGLIWSVGAPRTQKVYTTDATRIWPNAGRDGYARRPISSSSRTSVLVRSKDDRGTACTDMP